jgi:hypothetical protein
MAEQRSSINEAVARHDVEIDEIRRLTAELSRGFGDFRTSVFQAIDELRRIVSGVGRTDMRTIISVLGVMVAGFTATFGAITVVGTLVGRPVIEDIRSIEYTVRGQSERMDETRADILRSHEALRGIIAEQETQMDFIQKLADIRVGELYHVINADRAARDLPPLPQPDLNRSIVNRANIPNLFEGGRKP